eukprot:3197652-Amphidinium_carterae.1
MLVTAAAATIQGAARSRRMIRAGDEMHPRKGQMDGTLNGYQVEGSTGVYEARCPGYWTTEGVWMKTTKDENEHGHIGPKPPPPDAVGS